MSATDDSAIQQKQELLRELLRRRREHDAATSERVHVPAAQDIPARPVVAPAVQTAARPIVDRPVAQPVTHVPATPAVPRRSVPRDLDTSVIDGQAMDRIGIGFVRAMALVLLAVGFFGSILAFNGNWTPSWRFWEGINPLAAIAGLGIQIEITIVEWWRGRRYGFDVSYWAHLLLDTTLTLVGFGPVLAPLLTRAIHAGLVRIAALAAYADWSVLLSWGLLAIGAFLIARMPERWLVRR